LFFLFLLVDTQRSSKILLEFERFRVQVLLVYLKRDKYNCFCKCSLNLRSYLSWIWTSFPYPKFYFIKKKFKDIADFFLCKMKLIKSSKMAQFKHSFVFFFVRWFLKYVLGQWQNIMLQMSEV
jgi:hypothetical protein